jgi:CheY-like chemotaxis protein
MARILVIDDDDLMRAFVVALLEKRHYSVVSANNGLAGIARVSDSEFDLVVTDMVMPDMEGLETIKHIRRHKPTIKILAVSGGGSTKGDYLKDASSVGANAVLAKPFEPAQFLKIVSDLTKASRRGDSVATPRPSDTLPDPPTSVANCAGAS